MSKNEINWKEYYQLYSNSTLIKHLKDYELDIEKMTKAKEAINEILEERKLNK